MKALNKSISLIWFKWHFSEVPKRILRAWKNFLLFNLNFFSIFTLFKTLFFYWRKYRYSYGKRFDLKRYFEAFTFNMFSRVIGAVIRCLLIVVGLLFEVLILIIGAIALLGWIFMPLILLSGFLLGIKLLF